MRQTELIMGMPVIVEVVADNAVAQPAIRAVMDYFKTVDERFSTYKTDSEISQINRGLPRSEWTKEMAQVLELCEQTKQATNGYFNIVHAGQRDPSGLVKGWAIQRAAELLLARNLSDFYIEAGGDIQVSGHNPEGEMWRIGVRNPFNRDEIIKIVAVTDEGVATSGTYIRGQHIYNPLDQAAKLEDVQSLTVIGPNIYEADRFATAAFAMGLRGIEFIESLPGFEAYMIDADKVATLTSGFERYIV